MAIGTIKGIDKIKQEITIDSRTYRVIGKAKKILEYPIGSFIKIELLKTQGDTIYDYTDNKVITAKEVDRILSEYRQLVLSDREIANICKEIMIACLNTKTAPNYEAICERVFNMVVTIKNDKVI